MAAASRFEEIHAAVLAYIETAKSVAADGISWSEFGALLAGLLHLAVGLADVLSLAGSEKKLIVLEAAAALFDSVADKCIPVWLWPIWVLARSPMRALILALASGIIEQLVAVLRSKA